MAENKGLLGVSTNFAITVFLGLVLNENSFYWLCDCTYLISIWFCAY